MHFICSALFIQKNLKKDIVITAGNPMESTDCELWLVLVLVLVWSSSASEPFVHPEQVGHLFIHRCLNHPIAKSCALNDLFI